jgi:hypothetical protein
LRPLVLSLLPLLIAATPVSGRLGSPTGAAPAETVYAWSLGARHLYSADRPAGSAGYTIELPPGRYLLFAVPAEPGAPPVYGAYTPAARCAHGAKREDCEGHGLLRVDVQKKRIEGIDLTDWSITDDAAALLDGILGRASGETWSEQELAAPKFSEYPAGKAGERAGALAPSDDARVARDSARLSAALAGEAANFAGDRVLLHIDCGAGCADIALLALSSGRVEYPAPLNPLPSVCPPHEALTFRTDSRLLILVGEDGEKLANRYFVLDDDKDLKLVATLIDSREAPCPHP